MALMLRPPSWRRTPAYHDASANVFHLHHALRAGGNAARAPLLGAWMCGSSLYLVWFLLDAVNQTRWSVGRVLAYLCNSKMNRSLDGRWRDAMPATSTRTHTHGARGRLSAGRLSRVGGRWLGCRAPLEQGAWAKDGAKFPSPLPTSHLYIWRNSISLTTLFSTLLDNRRCVLFDDADVGGELDGGTTLIVEAADISVASCRRRGRLMASRRCVYSPL